MNPISKIEINGVTYRLAAEDGFSPTITTTSAGVTNGVSIVITDVNGTKRVTVYNGRDGRDGRDGKDYVLSDADKALIVQRVLEAIGAGGGGSVDWLFLEEDVTTTPRNDLPGLEDGVSYTAFVNGVEVETVTCEHYDYNDANAATFTNFSIRPQVLLCYTQGVGWSFDTLDSTPTGKVSIRINR